MGLCFDGTLVMPNNYGVMDENEMTYVEGGSITLGMLKTFTDKSTCMLWAIKLIDHRSVTGMTYQQVAEEIYAHAYVYYNFNKLPVIIKNNPFAQSIYTRASDGIHIEDGGDKATRRAFYSMVWAVC